MRNLLSANFSRLWRSAWFWLCGLGMLGYTLWEVSQLYAFRAHAPTVWEVERADFATPRVGDCSLLLLIAMAVLCPLFLNSDFHDGTIRNKLVVGRTRAQVYLANYLTMLAAALLYTLLYEAVLLLAIGFTVPENLWNAQAVTIKLVGLMPFIFSVAALFTLLGQLVRSRGVTVLSILLMVLLLWLPRQQFDRLCEPEEKTLLGGAEVFVEVDETGEPHQFYWRDGQRIAEEDLETVPNPRYLAAPLRTVYTFLLNFLPGGQAFQLSDSIDVEGGSGPLMAAYGLLLSMLATGAGLLAFRRMDLK